jgi:two-component system response regulator YesN
MGRQVDHIREIPRSYEAASRAMAQQYVLGTAALYPEERPVSLESIELDALNRQAVDRFLISGAKGDEEYLVAGLIDSIGPEQLASAMLRQYVAMSVYVSVFSFAEKLGFGKEHMLKRCGDIGGIVKQLSTVESTRLFLIKIIREGLRARDEKSLKRHSAMLRAAQTYIDEHFHEESLSLKSAAKAANVSPTHFSAIFSQEMGCTFMEYLASRRMEKAKELLVVSDMRASEIAAAVGYKDSHYFSFLFKKTTGFSPREFRTEKRVESGTL